MLERIVSPTVALPSIAASTPARPYFNSSVGQEWSLGLLVWASGEIGKRTGIKIPYPQGYAGSSPAWPNRKAI